MMHDPRLATFAALSAVLAVACGSSSKPEAASDAGLHADAATTLDAGKLCSAFGTPTCARGQTCCLSDFTGTCRERSACQSTVQFECSTGRDCDTAELCCGTFADQSDGGVTATTFCHKSCALPERAVCHTSADCSDGDVCTLLPEGTNSPILAAAVEAFSVCLPPDAGAP